jgi:hypothetical protein
MLPHVCACRAFAWSLLKCDNCVLCSAAVSVCPQQTASCLRGPSPTTQRPDHHRHHHHLPPTRQLRKALEAVFSQPGAVLPTKARFFRGAMTTIISRALTDLNIKPLPSRRCFSIMSECGWLVWSGWIGWCMDWVGWWCSVHSMSVSLARPI